ncbi:MULTISPECIES: hypothetical protein [unclassified Acidovorax]|uniref:hypothetical protein n=1 Tax=unclassified Acidovorax TaxID=2684926 RepID=UPI0028832042|nr:MULTISPECIES: hypothetical protein [unclassified Acidovorax]
MANLLRLVLLLFLSLCGNAHAAGAQVPQTTVWYIDVGGQNKGPYDTVSAACGAYASSRNADTRDGYNVSLVAANPDGWCQIRLRQRNRPDDAGSLSWINAAPRQGCPEGYTLAANGMCDPPPTQCEGGRERDASGQCTCKKGTKEPVGGVGACVPDGSTDDKKCADAALLHNSIGTDRVGRINGKHPLGKEVQVCRDSGVTGTSGQPLGCAHSFTGESSFQKPDGWVTEGESWANTDSSSGNGVGLACALGLEKDPNKPEDADKVPEEKKPPSTCRNGYAGSVNGVSVCVDRASGEQNGVDFNRVTSGNGDQTDVRTSVTCVRDNCTVTQDKTPAGGGTTTTTVTNNVDRAQFCRSNPKNPVCGAPTGSSTKPSGNGDGTGTGGDGDGDGDGEDDGDKSSFGGSCSAGFTCKADAKGDAIQCAIAKEQHKRNCDLLQTEQPDADYAAAADGSDEKSADSLKGKAEQVSVSQLDASGFGWSRACPADITFDVVGKTFAIPFSKVCPILNVMALAAVALTLLSCLLWVVGKKE